MNDQVWVMRYLLVDTENRWVAKKVLVSPACLTRVTRDTSRTLCCIAMAVDNSIGSGRAAIDCRAFIPRFERARQSKG